MANNNQQKKRIRQDEKKRVRNSDVKGSIRTVRKNVIELIESKDNSDLQKINDEFKKFVKIIDTAAGKGILHKNSAARKKSRLSKMVNAFSQQQA